MGKKAARHKRARKTRARIKKLGVGGRVYRLCVHRSAKNIYVQVYDSQGKVLTSASTLDKSAKEQVKYGGNVDAAKKVGEFIAQRCLDIGITQVAFDRSGFKYHGRIKALADAARENGLQI